MWGVVKQATYTHSVFFLSFRVFSVGELVVPCPEQRYWLLFLHRIALGSASSKNHVDLRNERIGFGDSD